MSLSLSLGLMIGRGGGARSRGLESLFANGENGFLFGNFAELDELFTTSNGPINVAANDDPVGLALDDHSWGGKTFAQVMAAQPEKVVNGGFASDLSGWTTPNGSATWVAGRARVTSIDGTASGRIAQAVTCEIGKTYAVTITGFAVNGDPRLVVNANTSPTGAVLAETFTPGTITRYFVATATTMYIMGWASAAAVGTSAEFDDVSLREAPGNHVLQPTAGNRPQWKANAGKPYLEFDGVSKYAVSPYIPNNAGTVAVGFRGIKNGIGAIYAIAGGGGTGNKRFRLGLSASGRAEFDFNDQFTIATATDYSDVNVVLIQRWGAGRRDCFIDGINVLSEARVSNHDGTGAAFNIGVIEGSSPSSGFLNGRLSALLATSDAVSDAEIAMITSAFQRTFQ